MELSKDVIQMPECIYHRTRYKTEHQQGWPKFVAHSRFAACTLLNLNTHIGSQMIYTSTSDICIMRHE